MKLRGAFWLLLCIMLTTLGCSKGDTGPTGPRGPAGSANVIYSDWYAPETWELESEYGITQRYYMIHTTALTQAIVDRGVVLVYMRFAGLDPEIVPLPVLIANPGFQFYFRAQQDSLKVVYYSPTAPSSAPVSIPPQNQIRYVLIPGGAAATAQAAGATGAQERAALKSMPYAELCRRYGISD